ncbi:Rv1535 family protein [Mycobacterium asiaticum]|uniref:Uncharacterized protein n=1 Tax=Mycobacterium asiaticum TaxID=1790 RepID=A0A1A3NH07_MYCAS|nr:Rv1535 family protein [Mycobacterium asiaticum]OBK21076.1 hypothetical protein A5635_24090 [Mycobacterium asiaticum]OBK96449.1 hypothetical protein A5645_08345 [Mycobacterium asiaticum]
MTAALYDEVVTLPAAPQLHVVRDVPVADVPAKAPAKAARRIDEALGAGSDPLVDGAARLLTIPLRHLYAALWRVGVLEVQA